MGYLFKDKKRIALLSIIIINLSKYYISYIARLYGLTYRLFLGGHLVIVRRCKCSTSTIDLSACKGHIQQQQYQKY